MKKILSYLLIAFLPVMAVSCSDFGNDGPENVTGGKMKGVFYADASGINEIVEVAHDGSKTFEVKAHAFHGEVADISLKITIKADPEKVAAYNEANGKAYTACPGTAYEFLSNEVMMPRYGAASTTAKIKITPSGMEDEVVYALPLAIESVVGTDNWAPADTLAGVILVKKKKFDAGAPGSEANPYLLSTVDDLKGMADKLVEGSMVYFRLENDIDMAGVTDWVPVNQYAPYKKFDFNGGGHTISNFSCVGAPVNPSFFGAVAGKLYDLTFTNANVDNTAATTAVGIVGSYGGSTDAPAEVSRVYVQGKVNNPKSNGTGGLFGIISSATINQCSADVIVTAPGKYDIGGIYGYDNTPEGEKASVITNCWTSGDISGNRMCGGIAGMFSYQTSETVIKCCYSTAAVHANFKYGGIVGDALKGGKADNATLVIGNRIEKCIAWNERIYSDVTDNSEHYSAGAIVGYTALKNYHIDCYRKADLDFSDCPGNNNDLYDQANSSPESPLVEAVTGTYNFPYHGKAAPAGATISDVAKSLGWDEGIWVLTDALPHFKGSSAPVEKQDVNPGGQLPGFGDNEFYK